MSLCADYPAMETRPEGGSGETAGWLYDACASTKNALEIPGVCFGEGQRKESFQRE